MLSRIVAVLLLSSVSAFGVEDPRVTSGFDHFYNLEYAQALADFEQALKAHPNDPDVHNNIAQTLLYREMYRDGALETELVSGSNAFLRSKKLNAAPEVTKRFESEIDQALTLAKNELAANPNNVDALHAAAVSYGLRSNYNFLVRKAWRDALSDATDARKMDDKLLQLRPNDVDAKLIQGVHEYIVGSLSWTARAVGFLAGFHGDKEDGIRKLQEVARYGERDRLDAKIVLCAIYRREERERDAVPLLNELIKAYPRNHLLLFEKARMYAALGDKKEALAAIDQVADGKTAGLPGFAGVSWQKIYYERGNIQFWYNDLDQALGNLQKAATGGDIDMNSGVLARMREGQIYDLQHHHDLACKAYEQAIAFAPDSDAAKESRRYINSAYKRVKS